MPFKDSCQNRLGVGMKLLIGVGTAHKTAVRVGYQPAQPHFHEVGFQRIPWTSTWTLPGMKLFDRQFFGLCYFESNTTPTSA